MQLPLGYPLPKATSEEEPIACQLNKSMYRLKQASRQWFTKYSFALLQHGFSQSKSDYSLFHKGKGVSLVVLLVYVAYMDNIILASLTIFALIAIKSALQSLFKLKDLGSLKYFLGLEIAKSSFGIFLSQRKYTLSLLDDTGFLASKTAL